MTADLHFFVPGSPAPQGSKKHIGGGRMIESSAALKPWRNTISTVAHQALKDAGGQLETGAARLNLIFVMPRPKATPKSRTPPAVKRPDLDKLTRAVFDGITNILIADDSQITKLGASKVIADIGETPGVHITLRIEPTP
ncbi:RusA family crossover junction endodeoxyribonuclease [Rhodococcus erythropolis]|nr:RusA family crossover junction endodeoxyribonuclease [Rhodococcus erythropolis]